VGHRRRGVGEARHALLAHLRNLGVRVLVDSQSWRFADERTWEVAKYSALEHRPSKPLDLDDTDALAAFVEADLKWQLTLGAGRSAATRLDAAEGRRRREQGAHAGNRGCDDHHTTAQPRAELDCSASSM